MKLICTAFDVYQQIAQGELPTVVEAAAAHLRARPEARILIFDDSTGGMVDIDLHGTPAQVSAQVAHYAGQSEGEEHRGPGRPKLGVVAREVTLLPRHWEWLAQQPGGASVTLRKLVDSARGVTVSHNRVRRSQEATYRFLSSLAGDLPGFESVSRALFAGDHGEFEAATQDWPADVRAYALRFLAEGGAGG